MTNLKEIHNLSAEELSNLIRNKGLTFRDLDFISFSPYFPLGHKNRESFNLFSRQGLSDIEFFIKNFGNIFRSSGVLAVSITGSAALGIANEFPYGCKKYRYPDGYYLEQEPGEKSDIDVELLVKRSSFRDAIYIVYNRFQEMRRTGGFSSPLNSFSFGFYPIEDIYESLEKDPYSSALVRFGAWSISRRIILGSEIIDELRVESQRKINQNEITNDFFWDNLADRYLFHQLRIRVKRGDFPSLFIPSYKLPTLFNPDIRARKMSSFRVLFNPDDQFLSI
jgi:hypothetical protein